MNCPGRIEKKRSVSGGARKGAICDRDCQVGHPCHVVTGSEHPLGSGFQKFAYLDARSERTIDQLAIELRVERSVRRIDWQDVNSADVQGAPFPEMNDRPLLGGCNSIDRAGVDLQATGGIKFR